MRYISGLERLTVAEPVTLDKLSVAIMHDMAEAVLAIEGGRTDSPIILAKFCLLEEGLHHDRYSGRLEMLFGGVIEVSAVPLFYTVTGKVLSITGRCSMIRSVCGADMLLNSSFTAEAGDWARQKFVLDINKLFKQLKAS